MLKAENLIQTGDVVINTGSIPIFNMGRTNMLKVSVIE
jgi:pyruvate kinase